MYLKKPLKKSLPIIMLVAFVLIYACNKDNYFKEALPSKRVEKKIKSIPEPKDTLIKNNKDSTENVIVLVIDGPRYTDTWGAVGTPLIPNRKALSKEGAICASFYNNGLTLTISGHTAIATGIYETLNNTGAQTPTYPSFMQAWRKEFNQPQEKAWVIATKDKVEVIKNCTEPKWKDTFNPLANCGKEGLGTGYRDDVTTLAIAKEILTTFTPNLMLINFKEPDTAGHSGDSLAYVYGIEVTDNYTLQLWDFIQTNKRYRNKTTLIITNDHGRHSAGHLDGFKSHGDNCTGCKQIELMVLGPEFKKNHISTTSYSQIDIAPTIGYLLGFKMPFGNGKVMKDLMVE